MAEQEIKVEEIEIDIKVEEDIWPSWVEDLQQMNSQPEMNSPEATVQAEISQVQQVTEGEDRMNQPHKDVNEPLVHLKPHSVFCTCLTTISMMTRSQSRRHKANCYKIYN